MKATDDQIRAWKGSGKEYQIIAAGIAQWAADKERGTALLSNEEFGRDLDFVASPRTYSRAKTFLVAQGVLSTNDGPFQVALRSAGQ